MFIVTRRREFSSSDFFAYNDIDDWCCEFFVVVEW